MKDKDKKNLKRLKKNKGWNSFKNSSKIKGNKLKERGLRHLRNKLKRQRLKIDKIKVKTIKNLILHLNQQI